MVKSIVAKDFQDKQSAKQWCEQADFAEKYYIDFDEECGWFVYEVLEN